MLAVEEEDGGVYMEIMEIIHRVSAASGHCSKRTLEDVPWSVVRQTDALEAKVEDMHNCSKANIEAWGQRQRLPTWG